MRAVSRLAFALLLSACATSAPVVAPARDRCETVRRIPSMGTVFEIQIASSCQHPPGDAVFIAARDELDAMESEMSLYQTESPISRLNREGRLDAPGAHLIRVTLAAIEHAPKTHGAFDPTIHSVFLATKGSFKAKNRAPSDGELERLRSAVGYEKIQTSERQIKFTTPGVQITLDGIAKGYAVDRIAEQLEGSGIHDYIVNFSGNMRWKGLSAKSLLWSIAIWDPKAEKAVPLPPSPSGAIASSSGKLNYFSTDRLWHHIISPRTLRSPNHYIATTAIGPSAMVADVLSTTLFVLSPDEIKPIFNASYPGYQYWALRQDGTVVSNL